MHLARFRTRAWLSPLVYLSNNWLSRVGVVFVTSATVLWIYLLPTLIRGEVTHPYVGILAFLALPGVFFGGLVLIPLGMVRRFRRERRRHVYPVNFPPADLHNPEMRRLLAFVGITTVANVIIGGQLTYSAVRYMDTVTFCGQTCHTVMQPEYTAYERSPHARVPCVECHIGPGASWFVRSKLSGVRQVFAVTFHTYDRPIPTPVTSLRPARETCEACHWPERFGGNRLVVIPHYADDKSNTLTKNVLLMHIGGGNTHSGIHGAHVGLGITIQYGSDESRQKMHWVEYSNALTGRKTLFVDSNTKPQAVNTQNGRVMDCIDCHNRPTHIFRLPDGAMDHAMTSGEISPSLPYAKKEGVELLKQNYASQQDAAQRIPAALASFYQANYPAIYSQQEAEIDRAAQTLVAIYQRNVFPKMKVTWGTYPDNLGHTDFPGCFRCHGELHASATNKTIPMDCDTCHTLLATDEANPKILDELGLSNAH